MEQQIEQQRLTAKDFHPEISETLRSLRARDDRPARFPRRRGEVRRRRHDRRRDPAERSARTTPGRSRCRRTTSASHTMTLDYDSPKGQGKMKGYFAKPAMLNGKLPGVARRPREPRPHAVHQGRRAAVGRRELRRLRARRADAARRLSGQRRQGRRDVSARSTRTRCIEDFIDAASVLQKRARVHRQGRRGRLLLRRQRREPARRPCARRSRRPRRSTAASRRPKTCRRSRRRC